MSFKNRISKIEKANQGKKTTFLTFKDDKTGRVYDRDLNDITDNPPDPELYLVIPCSVSEVNCL